MEDGEAVARTPAGDEDLQPGLAAPDAVDALAIESDLHGSAAYKKQLVRVYVKRAIDEARRAG